MSFLAQNIDPAIFEAHLLITGTNKDQKYEVSNIPVTFLNKNRVQQAVPALVNYLRKNKPKIVISAIGHLNTVTGLLGIFFPSIKFVARATTIPGFSMDTEEGTHRITKILYSIAFKALDKVICQSNDMKEALVAHNNISISKIVVINNPVTSKFRLKEPSTVKDEVLRLITIGRLTERKGYERVIKALAKLDRAFQYTIIGSGDYEDTIIQTIEALDLKEKVTLVPYTDRINDYLARNDIYLQGSYVEGFPNALLESCATGTPAVVYDAPGGINEIIVPGVNGYVAKDPEDFLEKLKVSIEHEWDPQAIRDSVYSRYSEEKILASYESFFKELVHA